jgi:hypothetical protein
MNVRVVHFGGAEDSRIDGILDGGRTLLIEGMRFTLRRVNGHFIREGEPPYGTRAVPLND